MTRTQKLVGAGVAAVLAIVVAVFLYLQDDSPDAPNIDDAAAAAGGSETEDTEASETEQPTEDASESEDGYEAPGEDDATAEDTAGDEAAGDETAGDDAAAADGEVAGTWSIDPGSADDIDSGTFAGYKVDEELANVGETTAFGRSPAVTGEAVLTDTQVESIDVTVDMTELQSDSGNRDNAIRTRGLETNDFPEASFTSTAAVDLPEAAASGEAFTVDVPGELTLHGVTNEVTVPLEAQLVGDRIAVVTSFEIDMNDYDITPPQVGPVLSIADEGTMELQLFLSRA